MTSLPSPISSVINIWLCLISHKDNGRGGGGWNEEQGKEEGGERHREISSLMQTDRGDFELSERVRTCNNG